MNKSAKLLRENKIEQKEHPRNKEDAPFAFNYLVHI